MRAPTLFSTFSKTFHHHWSHTYIIYKFYVTLTIRTQPTRSRSLREQLSPARFLRHCRRSPSHRQSSLCRQKLRSRPGQPQEEPREPHKPSFFRNYPIFGRCILNMIKYQFFKFLKKVQYQEMSWCNQLAAWFLQQRGSCWLGFSALPVLQLFICFKYWGRIDWRKCTWSSSCVRHAQTYVTAYRPSFNRYPSSSCMLLSLLLF